MSKQMFFDHDDRRLRWDAQQGQAILEAVLVLMLLGSLFVGAQVIARFHFDQLIVHSEAHYQAFLASKENTSARVDRPLAATREDRVTRVTITERSSDRFHKNGVGSFETVAAMARSMKDSVIARAQFVAYNVRSDSTASSTAQMHDRIQHNGPLWAHVADSSQVFFKTLAQQLGAIDDPWNRSRPSSEWLNAWDHLIPESLSSPSTK